MKLKFSSTQEYQLEAIQSVVRLFEGQPLNKGDFEVSFAVEGGSIALTNKGIGNRLLLSPEQLLKNVQNVQENNFGLSINDDLEPLVFNDKEDKPISLSIPNFTIEMETGTGKTYTYLRTIYELNKVYGFKKFVIVVPSVAIREGTLKNLEITHEHFQGLYNNPPINYTVYDSKKLAALRSFATADSIQVLVINIDSFAKDDNIINQVRETGVKPIEYIQSTQPFVIVDEPQNMETDVRKRAIAKLNPLCTLRYSATHRNLYNLIYKLDPVQAYDLGLVKQIEVDGISAGENYSAAYIEFQKVIKSKSKIKAQLKIYVNDKNGVKAKSVKCAVGADLYKLSNERDIYKNGFIINSIDAEWGELEFSNGLSLNTGHKQGGLTDEVMKFQIERTIQKHFEKERRYKSMGIKVLSLFFIDKVANYRAYATDGTPIKGKFALWFEELFTKYTEKSKYKDLYDFDVSEVHNGYFSQDKKGKIKDTKGNTKADNSTYNLIMKDKERLLNQEEPLRFIFSHSALREGWDNPNVFQICTLNESKSDLKKRQEIGRGLRLPVNAEGERSFEKRINILTVIANETYADFSAQLQKEIQEETSVDFSGRIKNAREKVQVKLSKELTAQNCPEFFELWDKIKHRTRYRVEYKTEDLIQTAVEAIKGMPPTNKPLLTAETYKVRYSETGVEGDLTSRQNKKTDDIKYLIPDIYGYIQSKVDLTRSTIYEILIRSERFAELETNPQLFLDNAITCIKGALNKLMIDGIKYQNIDGSCYEMQLFENEEIETYLSGLFEVKNTTKTLYNYVPIDSSIEEEFAKDCDVDDNVKFYFKLPRGFKIPTPIGNYNPDWAVIFDDDNRIYFIAETKSSTDPNKRRVAENLKIACGKKHFAVFEKEGVRYKVINAVDDLYSVS
jgi:type III restriction enzyme